MGRYWLGIDIGGTFTDFTLYDTATHGVTGLKVPSTPPDFAQAVEHGLDALAGEHGIDLREIDIAVHGTTIAVNTLIQRTGARLGLLVTDGFRDVLEIQRLRLPNPLDMHGGRPEPLIPRARVAEVRERLRADGRVDTALDEAGVATAARRLADQGAEGLVISLIHAYRDPSHERRARAVAEAAAPGVPVSTSHEVWPEAREYERTALAVLDAYVQPKVRRYLEGFEAALRVRAVPAVAHVTKSNGGIMPVAAARRQTVATLLSGPASGVIGAAYVAGAAGLGNLITLDVGGTSADIAVVEDGRPRSSTAEQIGGIPVMMPVVGVTAIGAGGGSVAWVDEVGVPKVGPQSTGASPGPACYNRGGVDATLSDAFVVSGFLDPERFLGGRMRLDRALAVEAIRRFADPLGMGVNEAAESVVRVAVSNMYAAFTKILSRAGIDQRTFALVAFGGAGPLIGSLLAREVGIPTVFVPRSPGTLCALGAITADILNDAVRTVHGRLDALDLGALAREQRALEAELSAWVREHGVQVASTSFRHGADMRYVGQSYEIEVPVEPQWLDHRRGPRRPPPSLPQGQVAPAKPALEPPGNPAASVRDGSSEDGGVARLLRSFHAAHERVFGHADPHAPVELVNLRVQLRGVRPRVPLVEVAAGTGAVPTGTRRIWLDGRPAEARVYERARLGRGDRVAGPAIVEQPDTTVLVPEGDVADVDRFGNLLIQREA